jgi:hypothetical protein
MCPAQSLFCFPVKLCTNSNAVDTMPHVSLSLAMSQRNTSLRRAGRLEECGKQQKQNVGEANVAGQSTIW